MTTLSESHIYTESARVLCFFSTSVISLPGKKKKKKKQKGACSLSEVNERGGVEKKLFSIAQENTFQWNSSSALPNSCLQQPSQSCLRSGAIGGLRPAPPQHC